MISKIKAVVLFVALLIIGFIVGCEKNDSDNDFGFTYIYMPQSLSSGGIDSMYLVPSGNGEMTYNFKAEDGKIKIVLGVMLSGKYSSDADFTVNVKTFNDITDKLIKSGEIKNGVATNTWATLPVITARSALRRRRRRAVASPPTQF